MQPGDLEVLRGVILDFSEEAKTRGLLSPSFEGFGSFNVVSELKYSDSQAIWWIVPMSVLGDDLNRSESCHLNGGYRMQSRRRKGSVGVICSVPTVTHRVRLK